MEEKEEPKARITNRIQVIHSHQIDDDALKGGEITLSQIDAWEFQNGTLEIR
jgi:hypothetical protein